jgi:hypothetical protein
MKSKLFSIGLTNPKEIEININEWLRSNSSYVIVDTINLGIIESKLNLLVYYEDDTTNDYKEGKVAGKKQIFEAHTREDVWVQYLEENPEYVGSVQNAIASAMSRAMHVAEEQSTNTEEE